jgi:hypothetical protein
MPPPVNRPACRVKAFTTVELVVSIALLAFVFGMSGSLLFFTSRNLLNLRDQISSQTSATVACERAVSLLRNATQFQVFSDDAGNVLNLTRIKFTEPNGNSLLTRSLEYDSANKRLLYFENGDHVGGGASRAFRSLDGVNMVYLSPYRVRLEFLFQYQGFALTFARPRIVQKGQFITDVIAKNHFIAQGQDAYDDYYTSSPVRL